VTTDTNHQEQLNSPGLRMRNGYIRFQSSGRWFNGYNPVDGSLVALASSSAIVISYSHSKNEIPSCKVIDPL